MSCCAVATLFAAAIAAPAHLREYTSPIALLTQS
jgi:hypothetical protein